MFDLLLQGFAIALQPENLAFIALGVVIGQIVGALPGLGPAAGMALLLPLTFGLEPVTAIMMLAGIMYGGQYGGTLTSVLINVPGEASGVMTALDGHAMARQGRAGAVLAIAAVGSFLAGMAAVAAVALIAPPLADFGLNFNAPEYFLLGGTWRHCHRFAGRVASPVADCGFDGADDRADWRRPSDRYAPA